MITQYEFSLSSPNGMIFKPECSYRLYAVILRLAGKEFADYVHEQEITPISQYVYFCRDEAVWSISLLGGYAEKEVSPILDHISRCEMDDGKIVELALRKKTHIKDVEELFANSKTGSDSKLIRFKSACAFKSQGHYVNMPGSRLIIQSLIKKWNGCMDECQIEDEDGEGINAIAEGMTFEEFIIRDKKYRLKGNVISGFTGEILVRNRLHGFHKELLDALLYFARFSGIGIKTTLGMGGVELKNN